MHSAYHEDHLKAETHCQVHCARGHNTLPQVVGPWLPCHDDSSTFNFYCTCMLALLKLWRSGPNLKSEDKEWSAALEHLKASNTPWVTCMLASLQYYYDSKMACKTASVPVWDHQLADAVDDTADGAGECEDWTATLSETDLATFKHDQLSMWEQAHAKHAIAIALQYGVFTTSSPIQPSENYSYRIAIGGNIPQLKAWISAMCAMADSGNQNDISDITAEDIDQGSVTENEGMTATVAGGTYMLAQLVAVKNTLEPSDINNLLDDQWRAYDIIDWHLQQFISGWCLDQLCMIIPGEGGGGKSKTIQMITENFVWQGVGGMLVKATYTGIAASVIDGKTLHNIGSKTHSNQSND
ncbi:hypothetical protein M404DRAFT_142574 [Pisolithus tinctorius Marx 270]|uniref:ATP-dependent DNA helicase n=1 Tax=Pisolithus tinctorius Marx 270 TaxID=870435 RepID=A0A0C3J6A7_PISTI|nr:hypothetical protein M404DRAFT_142574 [Pisolithus tinctorius Marx 270]